MKKRDTQDENKISYDKKTKQNQKYALMLVWFCIGIMGFCMLSSCGDGCQLKCGQVPEHKSGNISMDSAEVKADYYSFPSCGGCITSGRGCNSCFWGENFVCASVKGTYDKAEVTTLGCGEMYYGNSCGGCGTSLENVYMGIMISNNGMGGLYFGDSSYSPLWGSCQCAYGIFDDGCVCGSDDDGKFVTFLPELEEAIDYIDEVDKVQDSDVS